MTHLIKIQIKWAINLFVFKQLHVHMLYFTFIFKNILRISIIDGQRRKKNKTLFSSRVNPFLICITVSFALNNLTLFSWLNVTGSDHLKNYLSNRTQVTSLSYSISFCYICKLRSMKVVHHWNTIFRMILNSKRFHSRAAIYRLLSWLS